MPKYKTYNQLAVENALAAIKDDGASFGDASRRFAVPASTLKDKFYGLYSFRPPS